MIVTPTVGRKVWFRPNKLDQHVMQVVYDKEGRVQPLDATVVAAFDDHSISVVIFDTRGEKHFRGAAYLRQEGVDFPQWVVDANPSYAEWMPYQSKQAVKHAKEEASGLELKTSSV